MDPLSSFKQQSLPSTKSKDTAGHLDLSNSDVFIKDNHHTTCTTIRDASTRMF